jgi:hypothetical protein
MNEGDAYCIYILNKPETTVKNFRSRAKIYNSQGYLFERIRASRSK